MPPLNHIAIVGSRSFKHLELVKHFVAELPDGVVIISGGAEGVVTVAVEATRARGLPEPIVVRPDYDKYQLKVAPHVRNGEIAKMCAHMVAFWDGASGGTASVIEKAKRLGCSIKIIICEEDFDG